MGEKAKEKSTRKPKSNDSVSLKHFSDTERAILTLAAQNRNQSIGEFMKNCVLQSIKKTIKITFNDESVPQET